MIKLKDILSEIPPEVLKAMSSVDRDKNLARGCGLFLFSLANEYVERF